MNDQAELLTPNTLDAQHEVPTEEPPEPSLDKLRAIALMRARKRHPELQVLEVIDHEHKVIFHIKRQRGDPQACKTFEAGILDQCCDDSTVIHLTAHPERRVILDGLAGFTDALHQPAEDLADYTLIWQPAT